MLLQKLQIQATAKMEALEEEMTSLRNKTKEVCAVILHYNGPSVIHSVELFRLYSGTSVIRTPVI